MMVDDDDDDDDCCCGKRWLVASIKLIDGVFVSVSEQEAQNTVTESTRAKRAVGARARRC